MEVKLKSCPFCGSSPQWGIGNEILCASEDCCANEGPDWIKREDAIKYWNTRAPDPLLTEAAEVLRLSKGIVQAVHDEFAGQEYTLERIDNFLSKLDQAEKGIRDE